MSRERPAQPSKLPRPMVYAQPPVPGSLVGAALEQAPANAANLEQAPANAANDE